MHHRLVSSGLIELTFAVCLGWVLAAFHLAGGDKGPASSLGPLVSYRRVLQAHIDYILMGIIQVRDC
jgi:hypothetical protein